MKRPAHNETFPSRKLSARLQNPAERGTRGVNDPTGGAQTRAAGDTTKAPRSFEKGNPAKCSPKPL